VAWPRRDCHQGRMRTLAPKSAVRSCHKAACPPPPLSLHPSCKSRGAIERSPPTTPLRQEPSSVRKASHIAGTLWRDFGDRGVTEVTNRTRSLNALVAGVEVSLWRSLEPSLGLDEQTRRGLGVVEQLVHLTRESSSSSSSSPSLSSSTSSHLTHENTPGQVRRSSHHHCARLGCHDARVLQHVHA
jgi:hypothetical protein